MADPAPSAPSNAAKASGKPAQITLTFPDGAERLIEAGTTGMSVAKSISPSLAKRTVAMSLDGKLADLADPHRWPTPRSSSSPAPTRKRSS